MEFKEFSSGYYEFIRTAERYNEYFIKCNTSITVLKEKELSEHELYAIWYFTQNGYTGRITTMNSAKTEFEVSKDDVSDTFTLTAALQNPKKCNIQSYMQLFEKSFQLKSKICKMKSQLEQSKGAG